jgi:RHS repeat-associated protein
MYTNQWNDTNLGLYNYNARYYDPAIGKFISADTIVPEPADPQSWNRYAYGLNNPLRYSDPTGHLSEDEIEAYFGFTEMWQMQEVYGEAVTAQLWGTEFTWGDVLQYECNECGSGVGHAMLALFETSQSSETFRGGFWGIAGVWGTNKDMSSAGREVYGGLLADASWAGLDSSLTSYYQEHGFDALPADQGGELHITTYVDIGVANATAAGVSIWGAAGQLGLVSGPPGWLALAGTVAFVNVIDVAFGTDIAGTWYTSYPTIRPTGQWGYLPPNHLFSPWEPRSAN